MKQTNIYLLTLLLASGCTPKAPVTSVPPTQPVATKSNPATNENEALRVELADLIQRRQKAYDLMNELDDKGSAAFQKGDREAGDASSELFIPIADEYIKIQNRIDEIDKSLGTHSNREYSPDDKAKAILKTKADIAEMENHIRETHKVLEDAAAANSLTEDKSRYELLIRYSEVKLALFKLQLNILD